MASFNKITIVGYLGRDPELRYTPQSQAVCNFSIATTERRKESSGDAQESTTWFRVTVWGKLAEIVNQYLSKGKQVYVEGRLRQTEFTDREGNKRTSLEVTASEIQFISSRSEGDSVGEVSRAEAAGALRGSKPAQSDESGDNEIPF